ncbi:hypothetical protein BIV57_09080 [Mangrovactinospora gilvigrisea]|uniref:Protein-tyrosine-phosphatase n=1 Tax=Mangrovactinospora gilvigrisea TaxID=1428644 RepID=A0A1J7C872_9ACTN|nr:tyrosine-protein phosphatase [Mangrovactinospora gilvigrisea]OIV37724.1 hypothetical protein BIV57_09080 [Mangrovactinospora gilvigrisea]
MTAADAPDASDPQALPAPTVVNLRTLGGLPLAGGARVRPGTLYRSGDLGRLDAERDPVAAGLRVSTVVDLRTEAEREYAPDRVPAGARRIVADVIGDTAAAAARSADTPVRLDLLLADPLRANEVLGGGKAERLFVDTYRNFVTSAPARAAYATLLRAAAADSDGGLLFHCTAGKDRTGWGASLLLLLLGADEATTVRTEFLAVNPAVRAAFAPLTDPFTAGGGDPDIAQALIGVRPAYLDAALDALTTTWRDPETYARRALGLSEETLEALRTRHTETAPTP